MAETDNASRWLLDSRLQARQHLWMEALTEEAWDPAGEPSPLDFSARQTVLVSNSRTLDTSTDPGTCGQG